LSVVGVIVALLTLLFQFRDLNNSVDLAEQKIRITYGALIIFILSIVALAMMSYPQVKTILAPVSMKPED